MVCKQLGDRFGSVRPPFRSKNFRKFFLIWYALGAGVIWFCHPSPRLFWLGTGFIAAGIGLRGWGAGYLVKARQLAVVGPYAYLRHPLYAGTLLVGIGFALLVGGFLTPIALALLFAWFFGSYFPRKDRSESDRLESLFAEDFVIYRQNVPALWPRWRPFRPNFGSGHESHVSREWRFECYSENNELGALMAMLAGWLLVLLRFVLDG